MGFLDEARIITVSGDGGKGCVSFRRERFIPKGGPDGGDGGDGGSIFIKATGQLNTLSDFSSKRHFKAKNGSSGRGKNQYGKNGPDIIIDVPLGTIIYDNETDEVIADLIQEGQEILLLPGGKGGKGNIHFKTSTNRVPRYAQPGLPGGKKNLRLSLKYLADIGLIGLPNAGKSTLLSCLTTAQPKIDSYPFTTIVPNLGVIEFEDSSTLTVADIPGLIEGASEGKGLGHRFLKHIERTKFLLHLIDISSSVSDDPLEDFRILQDELKRYNPTLSEKKQLVIISKMDLFSPDSNDVEHVMKTLRNIGFRSLPISSVSGKGIGTLKKILKKEFIDQ